MMERIPVAGPWITGLEEAYVAEAVKTAWYSKANFFNERFEAAMAAYAGRCFAVALPSCTSGLHLALAGLGIGAGDEVIVPDLTWIATSAPIDYVCATPIFVDVDPNSWCLSAAALEAAITPRTRAAIVVDLYGNMPDWDALNAVAARYGIALIEDAAEAIGSRYRDRPAGSFGIASTFSFHGSKTVTTGEGGMLLTDDEALHRRCLTLRDHGRNPGDTDFFNIEVGFKYRMSSLQAAMGLAQVERLAELIGFKRELFRLYAEQLTDLPQITLNREAPEVLNTYWMVTTIFDPESGWTKQRLRAHFSKFAIDTRPIFSALSSLPAYADATSSVGAAARNPISYRLAPYGINLPSGYNMTPALVDRVCAAMRAVTAEAVGDNRTMS